MYLDNKCILNISDTIDTKLFYILDGKAMNLQIINGNVGTKPGFLTAGTNPITTAANLKVFGDCHHLPGAVWVLQPALVSKLPQFAERPHQLVQKRLGH